MSKPKILICMGTGGVGKTTVAAAIALKMAQTQKKILVLTIDPSQRLKDTLKLKPTGEITSINGFEANLFGAVINSKNTFDEFVQKNAPTQELAQKILQNKLYRQLSTHLSGSQEFTALIRLLEAYESQKYDLIILDTPPAQHAIDFLEAPQKLEALFQEKIMRWLRDPKQQSVGFWSNIVSSGLQMGTKQVLKSLEFLTGSDFVKELADFFMSIHGWQGRLQSRVQKAQALLVNKETHFILISSYDLSHLIETKNLALLLKQRGYHPKKIILNRAMPEWLGQGQNLGPWTRQWMTFFCERRERLQEFLTRTNLDFNIEELPEMSDDISDLEGIQKLANRMKD